MIISEKDFIWAFQFPEDGCGGFDVSAVNLVKYDFCKYATAPFIELSYKTKEEALNAMRKRLKEIENDNQ